MRSHAHIFAIAILMILLQMIILQSVVAQISGSELPQVVEYTGVLLDGAGDVDGVAMTGVQGVTFALYAEQFGGTPLWIETQNVEADAAGNFTALLGSASAQGLPQELFTANQARWLGVQANVAGSAEQPRVLFVSVPYALKSGDAETLGGLPASAYLLASDASESSESANGSELSNDAEAGFIGTAAVTGGTPGTVAKFDADGVSLIDSALIESGGKIGLGTGPDYRLDMFAGDGAQNLLRFFRQARTSSR